MKNTNIRDPFSGKMVRRLWIPAILSAIGLSIGDIADALVIGQKMGESGLTAVSICLPLYMIINVMIYGLGTGGSIRYSKLLAEGKPEEANRNFNHMLAGGAVIAACIAAVLELFGPQVIMLLGASQSEPLIYERALTYARLIMLSIPFFVIAYTLNYYLIADGKEKLAATAFIIGNIADFSLNVLLVLVLDMGVAGAALSTLCGQILTILLYLPGLLGKKGILRIKPAPIDLREVFGCFKTGFSTSVQYIGQFFFFMLVNRLLLGMSGENGVAVFDVLQNTSYVVAYLSEGTVNAIQPIVSTLFGEKNTSGMRSALRTGLILTFASVTALIAVVAVRPDWVCQLFGVNAPESLAIGTQALRIYCTGALVSAISIVLEGYEQARGNEKRAALLTVLRKGAVLFPLILLFAAGGSSAIWWFFPVTEWVSLLIYALICRVRASRSPAETGEDRIYRGVMHSSIEELPVLMQDIEAFCERWNSSMKQQMVVNLVAEEVCSAIVREGFRHITDGNIQLTLIAAEDGEFEFHIRDNADQFNPFSLKEKRMNDASEEMDVSAIGIQMIRKKVKSFFYRQYQGFNSLVIRV